MALILNEENLRWLQIEELKEKVSVADMRQKIFKAWLEELKKFNWKGERKQCQ